MKKLTTIFLSLISTALIAQIPNADFENWTAGAPNGWTILSFASGDVTESNTAQSGSHSVSLNSVIFGSNYEGGIVETGTQPNPYFPASGNPAAVNGWYQLTVSGGDYLEISAVAKHAGSPCGSGVFKTSANGGVWRQFSTCITYSAAMDSMWITLFLTNSGGFVHAGSVALVDDLTFGACTEGIDEISKDVTLERAYPNPASTLCNIIYSIPSSGLVNVALHDISGRRIETLLNDTQQYQGRYKIPVDVSNLSNGVYIYTITIDGRPFSQRLTVAR